MSVVDEAPKNDFEADMEDSLHLEDPVYPVQTRGCDSFLTKSLIGHKEVPGEQVGLLLFLFVLLGLIHVESPRRMDEVLPVLSGTLDIIMNAKELFAPPQVTVAFFFFILVFVTVSRIKSMGHSGQAHAIDKDFQFVHRMGLSRVKVVRTIREGLKR